MTDELDDLLGGSEPAKPLIRRQRRPAVDQKKFAEMVRNKRDGVVKEHDPTLADLRDGQLPDAVHFHRPVGISFLAKVLDTTERLLIRKLAPCPVVAWHSWQGKDMPLYDFKVALQYIVEPKIDIATWLKGQNAASLPNHINKTFWEGMNAKQRYMERAGHLWHDEEVLEVLGRTAMIIKEESMLWVENLPGKDDLTTGQYDSLMRSVTELLDSVHERLVVMARDNRTESLVASTEAEIAEAADPE